MQDMYLKDGRSFLYVGDVGRKLVINIPNLNIIRVCYETKEGFTKDVDVEHSGDVFFADIPNTFFSGAYSALTCYAIAIDGEYAYTASEAHFEIKDRQKSEGYSPTDQQLITWDYIETKALEYMNQTEVYMGQAGDSADNAESSAASALQSKNASAQSEANAKLSETNAKASETAANQSETNARASEVAAKQSEDNAQASADNAEGSASSALQSKNASAQSEANAKLSETNAKASETAANQSETNARASEVAAKQSEDNAQASADNAEGSASSALQSKNASAQSEANAKQSEINSKASETAAKQTLAEAQQIVAGKADKTYVDSNLATKADKSELAVERARIDSLSTLPEGSTTGDAELIGIRIGADGVTYPNAGEAVRTQILNEKTSRETAVNELKGDLGDVEDRIAPIDFRQKSNGKVILDVDVTGTMESLMDGMEQEPHEAIALTLEPDVPTAESHNFGVRGQICIDGNYLYVCVADNTWKKIPLQEL